MCVGWLRPPRYFVRTISGQAVKVWADTSELIDSPWRGPKIKRRITAYGGNAFLMFIGYFYTGLAQFATNAYWGGMSRIKDLGILLIGEMSLQGDQLGIF